MTANSLGYGCLVFLFSLSTQAAASTGPFHVVQSRVFAIEYTVNDAAQPLESVELWYTLDDNKTWNLYGHDSDRQSPMAFESPQEGLYGFYFVVRNAVGPSSFDPGPSTTPHLRVFVDYTPPIAQLHPLHETTLLGQRVLQIRWTAYDANFDARPVRITYRFADNPAPRPATPQPLANTGSYDWRIPDDVVGRIAVRLVVMDRGGNRVESDEQWIELSAELPRIDQKLDSETGPDAREIADDGWSNTIAGSARARQRSRKLASDARMQQERGDFRRAVSLLRQAVKLDPQNVDAFVALGDLLYRLNEPERALAAYELALRRQPELRAALRGAAMAHHRTGEHSAAAGLLRKVLRYNPADAEVWMDLGDIALYQGDEVLARECFLRASQINPDAPEAADVVVEARKRLDLLNDMTRATWQGEK